MKFVKRFTKLALLIFVFGITAACSVTIGTVNMNAGGREAQNSSGKTSQEKTTDVNTDLDATGIPGTL